VESLFEDPVDDSRLLDEMGFNHGIFEMDVSSGCGSVVVAQWQWLARLMQEVATIQIQQKSAKRKICDDSKADGKKANSKTDDKKAGKIQRATEKRAGLITWLQKIDGRSCSTRSKKRVSWRRWFSG
jgi:hypothetical protein